MKINLYYKKSKSFKLFDKIRNDEINDFDMVMLLRKYSNGYDIELLKNLEKDISFYLFIEKEEREAEFSEEEINKRISERENIGLKIPFRTSLLITAEDFRNKTKPKKEVKILDKEALLFPYEFFPIRQFQYKISKKIRELETSNDKFKSLNWKGTPTQLIELIKSLKESNVLDNSLSEKEILNRFELFFNTKLKSYNQSKTKIRNRIKEFTPFIDILKLNLEQWIKSKD